MKFIPTHEIVFKKRPLYITTAILIMFGYVLVVDSKTADIKAIAAAGILCLFLIFLVILSKLRLTVDNDGIRHQQLFRKQKKLRWQDITSSALVWHYHGHGASLNREFTDKFAQKFMFTPTFYSRKNLQVLAEALIDKCGTAIIDHRIEKMAEGKFPWYIF